ncbi:plastid division protein CDP1, chloroplastic isoform X2 [Cryptomeria japonica]|uniref:plastid division protein CDP1, chloroplastic isoform X2 n=1 Tax=Cryptomeria japonica TaxID=3369 RepID=UPI0027DA703A|nr:plastid division protein CDP1, chloroplastic isoform X2 [Cryptomeria japonica]
MSTINAMVFSNLTLEYIFPTKQRDCRSLALLPCCSHAKFFSSSSLMGRGQPRRKSSGSLAWAVNKLRVADSPVVENVQQHLHANVEIRVNCYEILGLPDGCSKDQVVKAAMELKSAEIDEGYSSSVMPYRQELLMDVRDKLLFEPEFAGNVREHVPPKSSLSLPWPWLPAALSLLQEVGEDKIVLEVGRVTMQQANAKPYIHDILLSMALSECSIARRAFESGRVSKGFDALARAQLLLRSKKSLAKLTLLAEIEASLEELAPTCLLEHLSMPRTPENAERREGALAALRELLRQGLEAEVSCAVTDWPAFLGQAMNKLLAVEIVGLLLWDRLATIRKNYSSSEARQQRNVINFDCFYKALLGHIAVGFSRKHPEMIEKANNIIESLERTEAVNLSLEGAICKILLGEVYKNQIVEEKWLKDAVLGAFVDTRDCTPSLVNYFGNKVKMPINGLKRKEVDRSIPQVGQRFPFYTSSQSQILSSSVQALTCSSPTEIPEAGGNLSPTSSQSHSIFNKSKNASSMIWNQNVGVSRKRLSRSWLRKGKTAGKLFLVALLGGCAFIYLRLHLQSRPMPFSYKSFAAQQDCAMKPSAGPSSSHSTSTAQIQRGNIGSRLTMAIAKSLIPFTKKCEYQADQNAWPITDLSLLIGKSRHNAFYRKQMVFREAESLVRLWQSMKAEALGPNHEIHHLAEILAEPMLTQWQALAESAKSRSCFWRFVLLHLSVVHAEISSDDMGLEIAEIEAVLEEAAELVDESQLKNPNYYSTYRIRYVLKKGSDGKWKFCGGGIQSPV